MVRIAVACVVLVWAGVAAAADQPLYAPTGDWVRPIPIPNVAAATDGSPLQVLLTDEQSKFSADADDFYYERALKILSPQGLNISGWFNPTWNPDTDTLIIHRLQIIRGDKIIDALADGKKFIVLRRENNLELAMLDGRLTAAIEPEGLQVGDIVDFALTYHIHDPALRGYSTGLHQLDGPGIDGRVYMRTVWPSSKHVRWRQTAGLAAPQMAKTSDGSELIVDMTNVQTPKPPAGAPARFRDLGALELSQFDDWADLSRVMALLYDKAATVKQDSPLAAEIAKIAAASDDPKVRAMAALRLVEDQTRYVFLGMDDGGLVPADAEVTWARRFGDCKGKTALLVAVLRALGVEAEPALVSTTAGDGMDQHLPRAGRFDHAIVRAQIAGKTWWLDGTRVGDRKLDDLAVPAFHWALPVRAAGAALVRLDPTVLTAPSSEEAIQIDVSKGLDSPAPTHIEFLYRGEYAVAQRRALATAPRADYERALREVWSKSHPWLTIDHIDFADDETADVARTVIEGVAKLDWTSSSGGQRYCHVPNTAVGANVNFKREPGLNQDAPYEVNFPLFTKTTQRIILPPSGGYVLMGPDVDQRLAGMQIHRRSRIEANILSVETSDQALEPEFPASQAEADGKALRDLAQIPVTVVYTPRNGAPPTAKAAQDSSADQTAAEHGDAAAQFRLAILYAQGQGVPFDPAQAMVWLHKAAENGHAAAQAELGRAYLNGANLPKDYTQAMAWCHRAAERANASGQACLGFIYANGSGVPLDRTLAVSWWRKAGDQGDVGAQNALGAAYQLGHGVPVDLAQAAIWYGKAADQGNPLGMYLLGVIAAQGHDGAPPDYVRARAWVELALERFPDGASQRSSVIQFRDNLAGRMTPTQLARAQLLTASWKPGSGGLAAPPTSTARAADPNEEATLAQARGNFAAELRILRPVAAGEMPTPDPPTPDVARYRKLADLGDVRARFGLALMYETGIGLPRDDLQAFGWYRKAADQGFALAQANLGAMYETGRGTPKDYGQAVAWYREAADAGNALGQFFLGSMYDVGHGVPADRALAIALYRRAAAQGEFHASIRLSQLGEPPGVLLIAPVTRASVRPAAALKSASLAAPTPP